MFLLNESYDDYHAIKEGTRILESTTSNGKPQVTIKTVLQTCDDVNKNKRIYPKEILAKGIEELRPMLESNTLVGEMDHPVPTGVSETDSYRHFVVLYQNTSHLIKDIYIEGNTVYGIVKTTSTDKGYNMAGLIMDGIPVGFSLRAMGESEMTGDGITKIKEPFNMITYDCVSNPSHAKARMVQIVSESVQNMNKAKALTEGTGCNVYMDRSYLLSKAFKESTYNKYTNMSNKEKLHHLMEHVNALAGSDRTSYSESVSDILNTYLGRSKVTDLLEGYLNDDSKDNANQVHTKILAYLDEFVGKTESTADTSDKLNHLFKKYLA